MYNDYSIKFTNCSARILVCSCSNMGLFLSIFDQFEHKILNSIKSNIIILFLSLTFNFWENIIYNVKIIINELKWSIGDKVVNFLSQFGLDY